jgi:hypothetical protein
VSLVARTPSPKGTFSWPVTSVTIYMQNTPNVIYARAEPTIILTYDSVPGGQDTIAKRDLQLASDVSNHPRQVVLLQGSAHLIYSRTFHKNIR